MGNDIKYLLFSEIDLADSFFDTLKADYKGFEDWFARKASVGAAAYVQYDAGKIQAFLYMKDESGEIMDDITPPRLACKRLKVGTFKIEAHSTKLGERFVKKILDKAVVENYDEVYVTIYPKHVGLITLLERYGFVKEAEKNGEGVYFKNMRALTGDLLKDYPLISTQDRRKFLLAIYPRFHTKLFPDSILRNEDNRRYELIKDVSYTNSIHKIYLCFMPDTASLKPGDLIAIYRTTDNLGPAKYRSVITSICQIEEVRTKASFNTMDEYLKYTNKYSIFDEKDLISWYRQKNVIVLKMTYNIALSKRVTRGYLLDEVGIPADYYWGFFQLTDEQFNAILKKGEINENIIVDKA
jgi:hypothetical protein